MKESITESQNIESGDGVVPFFKVEAPESSVSDNLVNPSASESKSGENTVELSDNMPVSSTAPSVADVASENSVACDSKVTQTLKVVKVEATSTQVLTYFRIFLLS